MRHPITLVCIVLCALSFVASTESAAFASSFPQDYYVRLKFMADDTKCLEGNRLSPESVLKGAAFMNDCDRQTGQFWKARPVPGNEGYFWLQTAFLESRDKCLEGNRLSPESVLKGAAFMNDCDRQTGQFWKLEPAGNGFFRLKTLFRGEGKCLEGNGLSERSVLGGASFMDDCKNVSGQLWRLEPVDY